jgi:hypothetical protein
MDSGGTSLEGLAGIPKVIEMIRDRSNSGFANFVFWSIVTAIIIGAYFCIATFGIIPMVHLAERVFGASSDYMKSLTPKERDFVSNIVNFILCSIYVVSLIATAVNIFIALRARREFDDACKQATDTVKVATAQANELKAAADKFKLAQEFAAQKEQQLAAWEERLIRLMEAYGMSANDMHALKQESGGKPAPANLVGKVPLALGKPEGS